MRGLWSRELIGWVLALALLPIAAVVVIEQSVPGAGRMLAALIAAAFWQGVFRVWHGVPLSPSGVVIAVAVGVLAPMGLTPLQIALGASFGIVLAELVFGGWGRNVIAPAPVALALLYLTYPGSPPPAAEASLVLAAGVSALLLLGAGILPLLVPLGAIAGALGVTLLIGQPAEGLLYAGAFAVGVTVLLADPVAAPTTQAARAVYGLLGGALAALIAGTGGLVAAGQGIVFAALLAQIFAPTLDHAALGLIRLQRERRHV